MPSKVVMKCFSLREGRVSIDLVRDVVEDELYKVNNCLYVKHYKMLCYPYGTGTGCLGKHSE